MNINIDLIKNYLQVGYQFAVEQGGKLGAHTVKLLKQALEHIRQDARIAGATIAVANIAIVETAQLIAHLADCCLGIMGKDEELGEGALIAKSVIVLSVFSSVIVGLNVALYKGLKAPLSPDMAGAISTASSLSYIAFRIWQNRNTAFVNPSESEEVL